LTAYSSFEFILYPLLGERVPLHRGRRWYRLVGRWYVSIGCQITNQRRSQPFGYNLRCKFWLGLWAPSLGKGWT